MSLNSSRTVSHWERRCVLRLCTHESCVTQGASCVASLYMSSTHSLAYIGTGDPNVGSTQPIDFPLFCSA